MSGAPNAIALECALNPRVPSRSGARSDGMPSCRQDFAPADMVGGADEPSFSIRSTNRAALL